MSQWRSFCIRKVRSQSPHEELHYKSWINVIVFSDLIFLRFILNCVRGWGRHTTWLRVLLTSLRTTMATNRLSKSLERLERRTPASVNFFGGGSNTFYHFTRYTGCKQSRSTWYFLRPDERVIYIAVGPPTITKEKCGHTHNREDSGLEIFGWA